MRFDPPGREPGAELRPSTTEAIVEVTITIGQSKVAVWVVGVERGEGRHRHRHRVRRGGEASAVPDERVRVEEEQHPDVDPPHAGMATKATQGPSRTGMTGRIGAASGQGACPRQLAAFPAVGDGRASWFVLRTRCPVHHIRKCHIVEVRQSRAIGHEIGLATFRWPQRHPDVLRARVAGIRALNSCRARLNPFPGGSIAPRYPKGERSSRNDPSRQGGVRSIRRATPACAAGCIACPRRQFSPRDAAGPVVRRILRDGRSREEVPW